nr:hypothetical protein [Tanacetum cinerariifolium]
MGHVARDIADNAPEPDTSQVLMEALSRVWKSCFMHSVLCGNKKPELHPCKRICSGADDGDVILDVVYDAIVAQEGVFSADDGDLIPDAMYDVNVVQEGVFSVNDEDVIPNKVYDAMVAQEGVFSTDDRDVIPNEVVEKC